MQVPIAVPRLPRRVPRPEPFGWLEPGPLVDGELELVLVERSPPDAAQGLVPAYRFELVHRARDRVALLAGRVELRAVTTSDVERHTGHVGYSVLPAHRGRRFAARACRLLLPLARRHGIDPLWITCNPENAPSRRTCEILGATYVDTVRLPAGHVLRRVGDVEKCRYRLATG